MIQTSIDEGILVTWTKTFKTKNVVGHEVVKMLRNALKKYEVLFLSCDYFIINIVFDIMKYSKLLLKNYLFSETVSQKIDIDIVAIVNDATGTMMMGSYLDKRSAVGLILGMRYPG